MRICNLLLILSICATGCATTPSGNVKYTFTLDGKPIDPRVISLDGEPEDPKPGDIIEVKQIPLVLGTQRECHFISTPKKDGRLLLKNSDGATNVIGVNVWREQEGPWDDPKIIFYDPLSRLSPAETRQLWGIRFAAWPPETEERLKNIDVSRTCVCLDDNGICPSGTNIPPVRQDVQYLQVDDTWFKVRMKDLDLSGYDDLRFLYLGGMIEAVLDAEELTCATSLRHLKVSVDLTNAAALGTFTELRNLDLSWTVIGDAPWIGNLTELRTLDIDRTGVKDISFAQNLQRLKMLSVELNAVEDLSPLRGMEDLRVVDADNSLINKLPGVSMPRLESLRVMQTHLSDDQVAAFQGLNPKCKIFHRWKNTLITRAEGANRIEILNWTAGEDRSIGQKRVHTITSEDKVQELLSTVGIDEKESGGHCMCTGGPILKLYRGDELLVEMTVHHGQGLRWDAGWPGDAELTPKSQVAIAQWFDKNGYPGLEKARLARIEEARARKQEDTEFWACFPAKVRAYFESAPWTNDIPSNRRGMGDYWSASVETKAEITVEVAKIIGDPVTAVVSVCRAMGSRQYPYSWSGRSERESMAVSVATNVSAEAFLKGLSRAEGDEKAMCGAALLFFSERHGKTLPKNQQVAWCLKLADFVLRGKGRDEKTTVLHWLDRLATPESLAVVRKAADGGFGDADFGEWTKKREPNVRATACLLLAMRHDKAAKDLIVTAAPKMKSKPDIAALEIAAVLVGTTNRIKKEHFEISDWTIPVAASQAIEENPSRENMDVLVTHAIHNSTACISHPALEAFARIAKLDWYKDGMEYQKGQRDEAVEWWKKNRQKFKAAAEMR